MLTVITGPMFSGKSSRLISTCASNVIAGKRVVVFKPSNDIRYKVDFIVSHSLEQFSAIPIDPQKPEDCLKAMDAHTENPKYVDLVCFDETQFFHAGKMFDTVKTLVRYYPEVVCAGLSQDSEGNPFGAMPGLLAIADNIVSLKAVCTKCKKIEWATRTFRKVSESTQVVVGGADKYEAHCYTCWLAWRKQ